MIQLYISRNDDLIKLIKEHIEQTAKLYHVQIDLIAILKRHKGPTRLMLLLINLFKAVIVLRWLRSFLGARVTRHPLRSQTHIACSIRYSLLMKEHKS